MSETKFNQDQVELLDLPGASGKSKLPRVIEDVRPHDALDTAWRQHMLDGFKNHQRMFESTLRAFHVPYWMTVTMYGLLFLMGLTAFGVALYAGLTKSDPVPTAIFGGLAVASFLAFFIRQPLQALEDNLEFTAWLGGIYNNYWTRMFYIQKMDAVQDDLKGAIQEFNSDMERLIKLHIQVRQKRPGRRLKETHTTDPKPVGD